MDKKKLIMAVILFAALIFIGIVLPLFLKKEDHSSKKVQTDSTLTERPDVLPEKKSDITFQRFEDLKDFMAEAKITELQSLFPEYLQSAGNSDITSVTFLSEQTTYPSANEVKLIFELSDETFLPVYCDRNGRFLFGEEKLLLSEDTITYEKIRDEKLPEVSASEVEELPEGGYPDTTVAPKAPEKED
ncbi:MAG: DUF5038 domain-containing protein [Eubacteriales bacterium]|nr:DUF5038 domain-containing protein [Eubacteriales bacterium]